MKLQAYQAVGLLHPEEDNLRVKEPGAEEDNTQMILEPITVLAASTESARVLASRKIDEKYVKYMHRVEVLVRPF